MLIELDENRCRKCPPTPPWVELVLVVAEAIGLSKK